MKKLGVILVVIMILSLALSACGPEKVKDLSGVVVEFWHVYADEPGAGLQALVNEFNETNEYNITVEALDQGQWSDVEDKVNAGIQSGDLPDVVMAYTNALASWYDVGVAVDLAPFIDASGTGLSKDEQDDLYGYLKDAGSMPDGAWVAYPLTQSANVLVYNYTWAEELGFPNPPANSAELKEQICAAAAANDAIGGDFAGTGGMVYYPSATNFLHFMFAFGGSPLDETGDAYDFTGQAAVDAAMYILDLKESGCIFTIDGYPNPEQAQRKALITLSSTAGAPYYAGAFEDAGNTTDVWGWLAAAGPDGTKAVNAFQQMIGVTAATEDEQLASWLFIKWLTSPEIQARWVKISGYYGTQNTTEELLSDYATENPVWATGVELVKMGPAEPSTFPAYQSIRRAIGDASAELFNATSQAEVEAILATLTKTANDLVAELE